VIWRALEWLATAPVIAVYVVCLWVGKKWRGHCYPYCDCSPTGPVRVVSKRNGLAVGFYCQKCQHRWEW
jgi:hypothetical protein